MAASTEVQMKKKMAEIDHDRAKYYKYFSEHKCDVLVNTSGDDIKKLSSALCGYLQESIGY